ncbi:MAG: bacillithiol biosynthesis BshC [Bacteroidota bacterium]|nr:bacillithiol biosynthesis BshC [Bacteroidota bacterium]
MKFSPIPLSVVNPDSFLTSYTKGEPFLQSFYSFYPFSSNTLQDLSNRKVKSLKRTVTNPRDDIVEALKDFHQWLGIEQSQAAIRAKLLEDDSYCVVTGQQLSWYAGPLYTFFKLMSAIQWSQSISEIMDKTVIPVFWLADEDHDYSEINQINWYQSQVSASDLKNTSLLKKFQADVKQTSLQEQIGMPVGKIKGDSSLLKNKFFKWLNKHHPIEEVTQQAVEKTAQFRENTWIQAFLQDTKEIYSDDKTHAQNFAYWITHVFEEYEFLVAGSNHDSIKKLLSPIITKAVTNDRRITKLLKSQTSKLNKQTIQSQVSVMDSQWFVYNKDAKRVKLHHDSTGEYSFIQKGGKKRLNSNELLELTQEQPERFSPNVFMRPILQDHLLPVIAYVGGPAEIAYHGQMKKIYEFFGLEMPILIPRLSATIREKKVQRLMAKFPFSLAHYQKGFLSLKNKWLSTLPQQFPEAKLDELERYILAQYQSQLMNIISFDKSLEGSIGKTKNEISKAMQSLIKKAKKAHESKFEYELRQLYFLQSYLFPEGPMERVLHPIYFMFYYGKDFWQDLLGELLAQETDSSHHYLIDL